VRQCFLICVRRDKGRRFELVLLPVLFAAADVKISFARLETVARRPLGPTDFSF